MLHLMGIEVATIGQVVVALANWAMANFGKKLKMLVYIQTYQNPPTENACVEPIFSKE